MPEKGVTEAAPEPSGPAVAAEAPAPRRRFAARRAAAAVGGVALAFWLFVHPASDEKLLLSLPRGSVVAALVRGLASQEKALLSNPAVEEALRAFGEDPDDVREENSGAYWTMFWLTGRRSALSIVPKDGECGELGFYLAGASAVGWKTRILEFLWRVKYVPFLGPLRTTPRGTRYMEFSGHGYLPEHGIVLGLDIVDGVLVAVLAEDPSLVEEVAARVRSGTPADAAPCLRAGSEPRWTATPLRHRVWIDPSAAGLSASPFTLDLGPLGGPGLSFRAAFDDPSAGGSPLPPRLADFAPALEERLAVADDGAFFFAAGTLPASPSLPFLGDASPACPGGPAAVWASGAPYAGRISIVEAPSIGAILPFPSAEGGADRPLDALKASLSAATQQLKPRWRTGRDGASLLHFKNLKTNLFGETPDDDCFWMRRAPGGSALECGTHFGSAAAQRADAASGAKTLASRLEGALREAPHAHAVFAVDFAALADVARQAGALVALGRRFGLRMTDGEVRATGTALAAVAALRGLGNALFAASTIPASADAPRKMVVSGRCAP